METDPTLCRDLEELLEPKGDPMSFVKWTTHSLTHLVKALSKQGTVAHYPPATSKWNKIEHRLFSFISMNWRAKPLTSLETVIELISHTSTNEGLQVNAIKDSHTYPTGITVTDAELSALTKVRASFHGEWNSTIKPQDTLVS